MPTMRHSLETRYNTILHGKSFINRPESPRLSGDQLGDLIQYVTNVIISEGEQDIERTFHLVLGNRLLHEEDLKKITQKIRERAKKYHWDGPFQRVVDKIPEGY